jgi:hypothetical protein
MIKKYMDEANEWRVKYFTLQRQLRDLLWVVYTFY